MESVEDLKARKQVLQILIDQMAAIRAGENLKLVPEATRREMLFNTELDEVTAKLNPKRGSRREASAVGG